MRKYIFILLLLPLFSCDKEEDGAGNEGANFLHSFIAYYRQGEYVAYSYSNRFDIGVNGKWITSPDLYGIQGITPDREEEAAEYRRLSERNGDTSFNRVVSWLAYKHWACFADNFKELHAICTNRDLDARHPAGFSIDDLLVIKAQSCAPFVRSGYPEEASYYSTEWTGIEKFVSELEEGELTMINAIDHLEFFFVPGLEKGVSYDLEITLVTTEGETHVVKTTFKPETIPGREY